MRPEQCHNLRHQCTRSTKIAACWLWRVADGVAWAVCGACLGSAIQKDSNVLPKMEVITAEIIFFKQKDL